MATATQTEKMALEIKSAKAAGRNTEELAKRTGLAPSVMGAALQELVETGTIIRAGKGKLAVYMHSLSMARLEKTATDAVLAFHEQFPEKRGMPSAELSSRLPAALPARLFDELLSTLLRRNALELDNDVVRKPGQGAAFEGGLSELEQALSAKFMDWGNTPERSKNVHDAVGASPNEARKAMERLVTLGTLIKVSTDLYLHKEAMDRLREQLLAHFETAAELTPSQWKDIVGASRKFTIPLAEYFDKEKLTLRVGDVRKRRG
jgi:selenocysteine-specific elongation factor